MLFEETTIKTLNIQPFIGVGATPARCLLSCWLFFLNYFEPLPTHSPWLTLTIVNHQSTVMNENRTWIVTHFQCGLTIVNPYHMIAQNLTIRWLPGWDSPGQVGNVRTSIVWFAQLSWKSQQTRARLSLYVKHFLLGICKSSKSPARVRQITSVWDPLRGRWVDSWKANLMDRPHEPRVSSLVGQLLPFTNTKPLPTYGQLPSRTLVDHHCWLWTKLRLAINQLLWH